MLNNPDGLVWAKLELNLAGLKKERYENKNNTPVFHTFYSLSTALKTNLHNNKWCDAETEPVEWGRKQFRLWPHSCRAVMVFRLFFSLFCTPVPRKTYLRFHLTFLHSRAEKCKWWSRSTCFGAGWSFLGTDIRLLKIPPTPTHKNFIMRFKKSKIEKSTPASDKISGSGRLRLRIIG